MFFLERLFGRRENFHDTHPDSESCHCGGDIHFQVLGFSDADNGWDRIKWYCSQDPLHPSGWSKTFPDWFASPTNERNP